MKSFFKITIIFLLFPLTLLSESKWELVDSLWVQIPPIDGKPRWGNVSWQSIQSPNKKDIIASAKIYRGFPRVFVSNDTGKTWKESLTEEKITNLSNYGHQFLYTYYPLAYPSTNLVLIGCDSGYYWRSTDNGENFTLYQRENKEVVALINFWDEDKLLMTQNDGVSRLDSLNHKYSKTEMFYSSDKGINWINKSYPKKIYNNPSYYFTLSDNGFILIEIGKYSYYDSTQNKYYTGIYPDSCNYIHKSTDYGITWEVYKDQKYKPYESLGYYFVNSNLGFKYGGKDKGGMTTTYTQIIDRTTDGGKSWERVLDTDVGPYRVYRMSFADSLVGIASAFQHIWWTYDGGQNWVKDTCFHPWGYSTEIDHVLCIDQYTAIGLSPNQSNYVYRYTRDHPVSVNETYTNEISIYPNPVFSSFSLSRIPEGSVSFEIFDIFGKNVVPIEAIHELPLQIDVSRLQPGIYFLKFNNQPKPFKFVKI
ncbi:MAG: hypothetical protein A2X64_00575 [Ignavibacteria bacterium GWF2_33_9]|nr:MAG: hypothetical protein A2X64_00575 [Ignavibacteria bacterium GWF2_33_9]